MTSLNFAGAHDPDCRVWAEEPCDCKVPGSDAPAGEWSWQIEAAPAVAS